MEAEVVVGLEILLPRLVWVAMEDCTEEAEVVVAMEATARQV